MCLIFRREMVRVICVYAPQSGNPNTQKDKLNNKLVYEWDMKGTKEVTLGIGNFSDHVEKRWMDLRVYMAEMELGSEIWKVDSC